MAKEQALPNLDDPDICQQIDSCGAYERVFDLSGQCQAAWQLVKKWQPPVLSRTPQQIVISGMGGSAIGGDMVRALTLAESPIPIIIHRDYGLPAFCGPQTLVVASSYSGSTEETLSAAEEAHRRGAPLLAVTTGGTLARRAQEWKAGLLIFDYPAQPREALGYGVVLLYGKHRKELSGGYRRTTNNRMELTACIAALQSLKRPSAVVLYSDSRYVVNGISRGWARRWRENGWKRTEDADAQNADLWAQLLDLCDQHEVEFVWVRGHMGNAENERCDRLSVGMAWEQNLPEDKGFEE